MSIHHAAMSNPLQNSVAGMRRASQGIEEAGSAIVQTALDNAESIEHRDRVGLSDQAQAALRGEGPKALEESIMDLKKHQIAYQASAKVSQMESDRFGAFSSIVARHG
jgi:hypothetical protein